MCCVGTVSCVLHKTAWLPGKAVTGSATRQSWIFSLTSGSLRGEIQFSAPKHAVPAHGKLGLAGCPCLPALGRYLVSLHMVLRRSVQTLTSRQSMNSPGDRRQRRFEAVAAVQAAEENIPSVPLCGCRWASYSSEVSLPLGVKVY